jgi:hypothetical protein
MMIFDFYPASFASFLDPPPFAAREPTSWEAMTLHIYLTKMESDALVQEEPEKKPECLWPERLDALCLHTIVESTFKSINTFLLGKNVDLKAAIEHSRYISFCPVPVSILLFPSQTCLNLFFRYCYTSSLREHFLR